MRKGRKIVLSVAPDNEKKLNAFVEDCIRNVVTFIAVAGENSRLVEEIIDELVVGDGSDDSRFIFTTSHPGVPLEEVIEFARSITGEYEGEYDDDVEIVKL